MTLTETAQLLGNFGEFFGAIAVVVTLGYLAAQIRQSTKISKALATDQSARSWADSNAEILNSESLWQVYEIAFNPTLDVTSLSSEDRRKAFLAVRTLLQRTYADFYLFKAGILEEEVWVGRRQGALDLIGTPIGQQWWENSKPDYFTEFVSAIEDG